MHTTNPYRRSIAPPSPRASLAVSLLALVLVVAVVAVAAGAAVLGGRDQGGPVPVEPSGSPSPSPAVTAPLPSVSPVPSATPGPSPTRTPAVTPSPEPTPAPTPTPVPAPTPTPAPVPTPTPLPSAGTALPACSYGDVLTGRRAYADWSITLLDTTYRLPRDYAPRDRVDIRSAGLGGGHAVRSFVVPDLHAMAIDARAAGAPFTVISAYRSHAAQEATFARWVKRVGRPAALRASARPGHSEHQLGTALDFASPDGGLPWEHRDWATTPAGKWLAANAWRHGFVMSYPKGSFAKTCYKYESWHYRYVGKDLAAAITRSGLTPREYLWTLR
jgi:zinc D-Ala-D-Ala carboxypeptidase